MSKQHYRINRLAGLWVLSLGTDQLVKQIAFKRYVEALETVGALGLCLNLEDKNGNRFKTGV